jgi:hypothetical protein
MAQTVAAARVPPENGQAQPETEPDNASAAKRVVLSDDLPLTLFVAVVTTVVLSVINVVPELLWVGVLVAPVLADFLKHAITDRPGWGKRRLLGLTGLIAAGGSAERVVRGRGAASDAAAAAVSPAPSAGAIVFTALLSSAIAIGTFTAIEAVRDRALLVDRPTTFLSAKPVVDDEPTGASRAGFATPGAAIAATARKERWGEGTGFTFTGRCPKGFTGGMVPGTANVMCWYREPNPPPPARAQLKSGERMFSVGGWSFHEEIWLALERSSGRWTVTRILAPPELPKDTGPITEP